MRGGFLLSSSRVSIKAAAHHLFSFLIFLTPTGHKIMKLIDQENAQHSAIVDHESTASLKNRYSVFYRVGLALLSALTVGVAGMLMMSGAAAKEGRFEFFFYFYEPEDFLSDSFNGNPPAPSVLQFDETSKAAVREVFERDFPEPRLRYWSANGHTAWIFDDLGKKGYQPTTSAFLVKDGEIIDAKVLVYRESRGQEVGEEFFLEQLEGARANGKGLTQSVDAITGATESVYMMQRMARTAIALDELVD